MNTRDQLERHADKIIGSGPTTPRADHGLAALAYGIVLAAEILAKAIEHNRPFVIPSGPSDRS